MKPVEELRDVADRLYQEGGDGDGATDAWSAHHAAVLRAWLTRYGPLIEAVVECEELWSRDYRNARDPGDIQRRLNEARAKVSAAYRAARGEERDDPK